MASRRYLRVAIVMLSLVLLPALASAQLTTGGVYGTVTDEQSKPLPGVTGQLVVQAAKEAGHRNLVYVADKKKVSERLERLLRSGDLLLTLGAGDVVRFGEGYLAGEGARRAADAGK